MTTQRCTNACYQSRWWSIKRKRKLVSCSLSKKIHVPSVTRKAGSMMVTVKTFTKKKPKFLQSFTWVWRKRQMEFAHSDKSSGPLSRATENVGKGQTVLETIHQTEWDVEGSHNFCCEIQCFVINLEQALASCELKIRVSLRAGPDSPELRQQARFQAQRLRRCFQRCSRSPPGRTARLLPSHRWTGYCWVNKTKRQSEGAVTVWEHVTFSFVVDWGVQLIVKNLSHSFFCSSKQASVDW